MSAMLGEVRLCMLSATQLDQILVRLVAREATISREEMQDSGDTGNGLQEWQCAFSWLQTICIC